mgnify:CR=1 FL=1
MPAISACISPDITKVNATMQVWGSLDNSGQSLSQNMQEVLMVADNELKRVACEAQFPSSYPYQLKH